MTARLQLSTCALLLALLALTSAAEAQIYYVTTPGDVVSRMLEASNLTAGETLYDLGSGDGRIPIEAARRYGVEAIGVEREPALVEIARGRAQATGTAALARFQQADIFDVDLSPADAVTLYLLPTMNQRLVPQLSKLRAGARIVSHQYPIPGVTADLEVLLVSEEDAVLHHVFVYTAPLVASGPASRTGAGADR